MIVSQNNNRATKKALFTRFIHSGMEGFLEEEALELLLYFVANLKDVKPVAKTLLKKFKSLEAIQNAEFVELLSLPGVSLQASILLKIPKIYSEFILKKNLENKGPIKDIKDIVEFLKSIIGRSKDETFYVIFLNTKNEIIEIEKIYEGTVDQVIIYPRKIIEKALLYNAVSLILAHNHPSGHVLPSLADKDLTRRIREAAITIDIDILDHIIIGRDKYFSFHKEGILFC